MSAAYDTRSEDAAALRRAAEKVKTVTLSGPTYDRVRRRGEPSTRTLVRRYGSWVAAVNSAGLAPSAFRESWDDAAVLRALRAAAQATRRPLQLADYERWRKAQPHPERHPARAVFRRPAPGDPAPGPHGFAAWCAAAGVASTRRRRDNRFSDADLVMSLRRAARTTKTNPLTVAAYQTWFANQPAGVAPHPRTFTYRYKTWRQALAAAGLPATVTGQERIPITEAILAAAADCGVKPAEVTATMYRAWSTGHPKRPSLSTIVESHGSWVTARRSAARKRQKR